MTDKLGILAQLVGRHAARRVILPSASFVLIFFVYDQAYRRAVERSRLEL